MLWYKVTLIFELLVRVCLYLQSMVGTWIVYYYTKHDFEAIRNVV